MAVSKCIAGLRSKLTVVLGAQWGDQGKGKLVDLLSDKYDINARFNGGANAGHSVVKNGTKYAFHLVPCGILSPNTINLLGNGVVVHLNGMFQELSQLDKNNIHYKGRMLVSDRAHLVTDYQLWQDQQHDSKQNLGTTKKGIGPTYAAKVQRYGLRVGDLLNWSTFEGKYNKMASFYNVKLQSQIDKFKQLRERLLAENMIVDSVNWINQQYANNKSILVQGANAALLDIDLGTYPYVTSSNTSIGGAFTGLGLSPRKIQTVIGVVKAYTTRVGQGPFPTELNNQLGQQMRKRGHEFGTTTGRPRRCGWLDLNTIRYTNMVNGYDSINITKLDILDSFKQIKVGVAYKLNGKEIHTLPSTLDELSKVEVVYDKLKGWNADTSKIRKPQHLPKEAINYLNFVQKNTGVKISWVGTGPGHDAMIKMV